MAEPIRMLIADRETLIARKISEFLTGNGINCEIVNHGKQVKEILSHWTPDFILIDLLLPDCGAVDLLKLIKEHPVLSKSGVKVLVTSGHNNASNVKRVFMAGAADYIVKPFRVEDILSRIIFHMQKKHKLVEFGREEEGKKLFEGASLYLHFISLVMKEAVEMREPREKLFNLMQMLGLTLKAVRCSLVKCDMENNHGVVIASSDDVNVKKFTLDLNKYPEIAHVMNTEKYVAIENLDYNPELSRLKKVVKSISFNSIVVCPVFLQGKVFGVVSARMDSKKQKFEDIDIRFTQLISYVASLVLNSVEFFDHHVLKDDPVPVPTPAPAVPIPEASLIPAPATDTEKKSA